MNLLQSTLTVFLRFYKNFKKLCRVRTVVPLFKPQSTSKFKKFSYNLLNNNSLLFPVRLKNITTKNCAGLFVQMATYKYNFLHPVISASS